MILPSYVTLNKLLKLPEVSLTPQLSNRNKASSIPVGLLGG